LSDAQESAARSVLVVADEASPLLKAYIAHLVGHGMRVSLLDVGGPEDAASGVGPLADRAGSISALAGAADGEVSPVSKAMTRGVREASGAGDVSVGGVVAFLTAGSSVATDDAAVGMRDAAYRKLASALDLMAANAQPGERGQCEFILFVVRPQSMFADSGRLADTAVYGALLTVVPALAGAWPATRVNAAVVWDAPQGVGDFLHEKTSMALNWLASPGAALSGYTFNVSGGHISRLFVGDTRGYAVARSDHGVFDRHRSDVISEDGFIIYQDLAHAGDVMNMRLITSGERPGVSAGPLAG
jgi:hypothetical protein